MGEFTSNVFVPCYVDYDTNVYATQMTAACINHAASNVWVRRDEDRVLVSLGGHELAHATVMSPLVYLPGQPKGQSPRG